MARKTAIPENLYEEILAMSANGQSCQKICEWAKVTHGISCSISSVSRLLKIKKAERQQVAQAAYAEAVAKSANQDLKIIDDIANKFYTRIMKAMDEDDIATARQLADSLHKYLATRIELSGINRPDSNASQDDVLQGLLDKLGDDNDFSTN